MAAGAAAPPPPPPPLVAPPRIIDGADFRLSGTLLQGGLAIGTVFVGWDKRRLIRLGFAAFAVCLAAFAIASEPIGAFISGFFLGFAYFGTTTSMMTVMQSRLADHERGRDIAE